MQRIVHVSGYSLAEYPELTGVSYKDGTPGNGRFHDWDYVCWGEPARGAMGRIPMAIWYARCIARADQIIWSTGCTKTASGKWESEYMFELAHDSFDRLMQDFGGNFEVFRKQFGNEKTYRRWLESRSTFDHQSETTASSMVWLRKHCETYFAGDRMIVSLISSANHAPRVLRDALTSFSSRSMSDYNRTRIVLSAVPAETSYGERGPEDTKVFDLGT
ncbi:MAG: hypothetical protein P4L81_01595 [Candidatus Pacebacteria bacterium]|nr:hypothetical protein [Candidatus Paceibacterota bacterium]